VCSFADDDIDICVPLEEEDGFRDLEPALNDMGYNIAKWYYGYKVFPANGRPYPDKSKPFKYPFLDVFFTAIGFIKTGPLKGKLRTWFPRTNWFKFAYNIVDDLIPLKRYQFGAYYVYGPHRPEPRLVCLYDRCGLKLVTSCAHFGFGLCPFSFVLHVL